ncbi:MAG: Coenzyme F420 hydrogenase/dehydrogenase, beta subunit C-terminal domain [Hespellia sp.]|nr:Coenzyme F420 hydrogenase/dehydrogenase, beta subunit C-terminal domain [Hespellia sp.]
MCPDGNGFFKPDVNLDACIGCGLCTDVCYSHADTFNTADSLKAYYGWHKDHSVLMNSASGGITSAICQAAIHNGFMVIGCTYDNNEKKAKHCIIREIKDIPKILGSKYFQSDMSDAVSVLKSLPVDSKIVFFGTPCQILGIKRFLTKSHFRIKNIYLVELFCHGIVSPLVWKEYIKLSKVKDVKEVKFRTKHYGWHIPANEFVTNRKTIPTKRSGDAFFNAYYSKEFFNKSCYDCEAKKNIGNADLRIGDYWGNRFIDNKKGVSCIISSSLKGEQLLEEAKAYFELFNGDLKEILGAQSFDRTHPFDEKQWNENYEALKDSGIKCSLRHIEKRKPLASRIKRRIYVLLSNIKNSVTSHLSH